MFDVQCMRINTILDYKLAFMCLKMSVFFISIFIDLFFTDGYKPALHACYLRTK